MTLNICVFYLLCRFDLELHVVHKNPEGGIAVIGIWYTIGRPDYLLSKVCYMTISLQTVFGILFIHDLHRV